MSISFAYGPLICQLTVLQLKKKRKNISTQVSKTNEVFFYSSHEQRYFQIIFFAKYYNMQLTFWVGRYEQGYKSIKLGIAHKFSNGSSNFSLGPQTNVSERSASYLGRINVYVDFSFKKKS